MPNYVYFLLAVAALIVGYIIYGGIVTRVFGVQPSRATPAQTHADGVDYVEMPVWKVWLVQLLNIAGVGPVFGPILGALWGPSAAGGIVNDAGGLFPPLIAGGGVAGQPESRAAHGQHRHQGQQPGFAPRALAGTGFGEVHDVGNLGRFLFQFHADLLMTISR